MELNPDAKASNLNHIPKPHTVSCAVNVVCELARKNPQATILKSHALYVCLICMPYMYALHVRLVCVRVCVLICMPYMYALYVRLVCVRVCYLAYVLICVLICVLDACVLIWILNVCVLICVLPYVCSVLICVPHVCVLLYVSCMYVC